MANFNNVEKIVCLRKRMKNGVDEKNKSYFALSTTEKISQNRNISNN